MDWYIQGGAFVTNATVYTRKIDMDQEDLSCRALHIVPAL